MIVSKTPIRISLGAGGIDLPSFYKKFGARFATAAGNKYIYVMVNPHPEKVVWMGMYAAERVDSPEQLRHPVIRTVLPWMNLTKNIEIVSISDIQSNSGLGSSSSFLVGLLSALHAYKGEFLWPQEIAEEACYVDQVLLGDQTGKQDQYAAALGGIIWMEIAQDGRTQVSRLKIKSATIHELEDHLVYFYTGLQRESAPLQNEHSQAIAANNDDVIGYLKKIQESALGIRGALERGDIPEFGTLMNEHWRDKSKLSRNMSNIWIDSIYDLAQKSGAIGGNLMGAGGGGYFMFVCEDDKSKTLLRKCLIGKGLLEVSMKFEIQGSSATSV